MIADDRITMFALQRKHNFMVVWTRRLGGARPGVLGRAAPENKRTGNPECPLVLDTGIHLPLKI